MDNYSPSEICICEDQISKETHEFKRFLYKRDILWQIQGKQTHALYSFEKKQNELFHSIF